MSIRLDNDSDVADFVRGAEYNGIDHVQAVRIASDLSKKYDFLSARFLLLGWAQLPNDSISLKITQKELNDLYGRLRSSAKELQECLASMHVLTKVDGSLWLLFALNDWTGVETETPKREEFQYMNECMFLGGVALAYDRMYPHKEFKRNVLLINAALDVQRSFNLGQQHSSSVAKDDPSSLNKYLQRGRQLLRVTTQERHRMTE